MWKNVIRLLPTACLGFGDTGENAVELSISKAKLKISASVLRAVTNEGTPVIAAKNLPNRFIMTVTMMVRSTVNLIRYF